MKKKYVFCYYKNYDLELEKSLQVPATQIGDLTMYIASRGLVFKGKTLTFFNTVLSASYSLSCFRVCTRHHAIVSVSLGLSLPNKWLTAVCNSSSLVSLLSSNSYSLDTEYSSSESSSSLLIIVYNIDDSSKTICATVVICCIMFIVFFVMCT
ncbi:hypothetical protein M9H77_16737 [Catharanthus roseus]|uniref:Uncharacterized protein n=1 Tax=Catharanthus roseus TaxID=4058 RepID=A0ACC0B2M4_CATRO|nr:hypothetical protein M9H77_16737 [Catharanthus roseus]